MEEQEEKLKPVLRRHDRREMDRKKAKNYDNLYNACLRLDKELYIKGTQANIFADKLKELGIDIEVLLTEGMKKLQEANKKPSDVISTEVLPIELEISSDTNIPDTNS